MAYKVINPFKDLQDNNTRYKVGDEYPKGNHKPSKDRIEELSTEHPELKKVFIEEVEEKSSSKKAKKAADK